jgi:hypothetical protein
MAKAKKITVKVLKEFKDSTINFQLRKEGDTFVVTKKRLEQIDKVIPKFVEIISIC